MYLINKLPPKVILKIAKYLDYKYFNSPHADVICTCFFSVVYFSYRTSAQIKKHI